MSKQKEISAIKKNHQLGQSIVIIAGGMVALIGFLGLVTDLGVIWARDAQLAAAVDAAVLAAATESQGTEITPPDTPYAEYTAADRKAIQFLSTNNIPAETISQFYSLEGASEIGAISYEITVTWDIDLYFMRVFGFETVPLTKSAQASYFPLVDLYASSRVEDGGLGIVNQSLFGPNQNTGFGDPFSPTGMYAYKYRIYIPPDYESRTGTNIVRVELFDPDSINSTNNDTTIAYSERFINATSAPNPTRNVACKKGNNSNLDNTNTSAQTYNACVIATCEWSAQTSTEANPNYPGSGNSEPPLKYPHCQGINNQLEELADVKHVNPFWYVRVDENRAPFGGSTTSYNVANNTQTRYELFYYRQEADGTLVRTPLATYFGRTGDSSRDRALTPPGGLSINTDLKWVSPGAFNGQTEGQPELYVPAECGSPNGGSECSGDTDADLPTTFGAGRGFEIDLQLDTPNIFVDSSTGVRYIYLDITAISGSSENGFETWAGPPSSSAGLALDGNARNVWVANNPNGRNSGGVTIMAIGRLPMNSNATETVDLPILYVPASYAGNTITVRMFDPDTGAKPPIRFYFDTIAEEDYRQDFGATLDANQCFSGGNSYSSGCNNRWAEFEVPIPDRNAAECTGGDPTDPDCSPFYGGRLMVRYQSGREDTFTWEVILPSMPWLSR